MSRASSLGDTHTRCFTGFGLGHYPTPSAYHLSLRGRQHPTRKRSLPVNFEFNERSMPARIGFRSYSDQMPSFSSIYEGETTTQYLNTSFATDAPLSDTSPQTHSPSPPSLYYPNYQFHRPSASTTDSTSSSPITVASWTDSHASFDTPTTSPDTPASSISLHSPRLYLAQQTKISHSTDMMRPPPPQNLTQPSIPSKKGRNLKNLAVNTAVAPPMLTKAFSTASLPMSARSSEFALDSASPVFANPAKIARRKASNLGLSIVTPSSESPPSRASISGPPPTPSLAHLPTLRHFSSSPSLPLKSPFKAPEGGMRLPPLATRRAISVTFAEALFEHEEDDEAHRFDLPQSKEEKPQGYPDGPICIYDPHIYLYSEPSAEQASAFDLILNVASEVQNPFREGVLYNGLRPEYVHIPWEHNTDIVSDLYRLVKQVDDKVQDGKRVLIHCQLGVSRSASLIVAYGLYKNPTMSVQEAYDAVKRRSKWIGPNMSLIMQLQEFRTGLLKANVGLSGTQPLSSKLSSQSRPTLVLKPNNALTSDQNVPQSAPIRPETYRSSLAPIFIGPSDKVSPGPSSAPSGFLWLTEDAANGPNMRKRNSVPSPSQEHGGLTLDLPLRLSHQEVELISETAQPAAVPIASFGFASSAVQDSGLEGLTSPRSELFGMTSIIQPQDDSFGMTAPRPQQVEAVAIPKASSEAPAAPLAKSSPMSLSAFEQTITSPRSETFAMTSITAPAPDDSFGLTSPRLSTFRSTSNLRIPRHNQITVPSKRIASIHPSAENAPQQNVDSSARNELKSRLGMATRSNYDLRSEYALADNASKLRITPQIPTLHDMTDALDGDALMSPRATTFTNNPFHDYPTRAAQLRRGPSGQQAGSAGASGVKHDPRSPAQMGVSPIVRNIFDVL